MNHNWNTNGSRLLSSLALSLLVYSFIHSVPHILLWTAKSTLNRQTVPDGLLHTRVCAPDRSKMNCENSSPSPSSSLLNIHAYLSLNQQTCYDKNSKDICPFHFRSNTSCPMNCLPRRKRPSALVVHCLRSTVEEEQMIEIFISPSLALD